LSVLIACSVAPESSALSSDVGAEETTGEQSSSAGEDASSNGSTGTAAGSSSDSDSSGTGDSSDQSDTDGCTSNDCTGGVEAPRQACDLIAQDCASDEKCTSYAIDGGQFWNATKCVPIPPDPVGPGEACTVAEHPTSGLDNCDAASMCYDVNPDTLKGVCVEFCYGDIYPYECTNPLAQCHWANDGALAICLTACDPMDQDCQDGQGCYPQKDWFECDYDDSNDMDAVGATCVEHQECPEGLFCAPGAYAPTCDGDKCCAEFCDPYEETNKCWGKNEGVVCIPLAALPNGPAPTDDIGVCVVLP
jgi:hypothetical protein